jgi:hypothetical protein
LAVVEPPKAAREQPAKAQVLPRLELSATLKVMSSVPLSRSRRSCDGSATRRARSTRPRQGPHPPGAPRRRAGKIVYAKPQVPKGLLAALQGESASASGHGVGTRRRALASRLAEEARRGVRADCSYDETGSARPRSRTRIDRAAEGGDEWLKVVPLSMPPPIACSPPLDCRGWQRSGRTRLARKPRQQGHPESVRERPARLRALHGNQAAAGVPDRYSLTRDCPA